MPRRAWRGWEDLSPMQDLLSRALRDRPKTAILHPGDLAWWIGWPPHTEDELTRTVTVWETDGRVRAWVCLGGDEAGECVDPSAPEHAEAVDRHLAERPRAVRYVRDDDDAGVARLVTGGYQEVAADRMQAFSIDLAALGSIEADPRVRAVEPGDDLRPRCAVTRGAFRVTDRPFERYVEQYAAFMASPAYPTGWDLVVWAEPGVAAACTIAWPDAVSGVGNFEPVATHPDHRRRGFGASVLREGFRRLREAGMSRAIVCTPATNDAAIALYRSVGFVEDHVQLAFRRGAGAGR